MLRSKKLTNEEFKIVIMLLRELVWSIGQAGFRGKVALKGALALYDISFGGISDGYMRGTQDIDLDIRTKEDYERLFDNIINIANNNRLGVIYKPHKRRDLEGISAGISIQCEYEGNQYVLKIDMNINEFYPIEVTSIDEDEIERYTDTAMLVTKIVTCCNKILRRRVKDMYDIAALCTKRDFLFSDVVSILKLKYPEDVFTLRPYVSAEHYIELKDAVMGNHQFKSVNFDELFSLVYDFLNPLTACLRDYHQEYDYKWYHNTRIWTAYMKEK